MTGDPSEKTSNEITFYDDVYYYPGIKADELYEKLYTLDPKGKKSFEPFLANLPLKLYEPQPNEDPKFRDDLIKAREKAIQEYWTNEGMTDDFEKDFRHAQKYVGLSNKNHLLVALSVYIQLIGLGYPRYTEDRSTHII